MSENHQRIEYVDIARGIAILCIIMGHLNHAGINRIVFTFHVPVFFLISGYFLSEKVSMTDFIRKRLKDLIFPYVVTCIAMIVGAVIKEWLLRGQTEAFHACLSWGYAALYGAGDSYTEPFYIKSIGAIWFLWASFWGGIFLKAVLKLESKKRIIAIAGIFAAGYISREWFWFPFSIQAGCCAALFMYIGYLCRANQSLIQKVTVETKSAITLSAVIIWLSFIRDFQTFWLVHCDIGRGAIDIFGSLCGCYVVICISKLIEAKFTFLGKGLAWLGKYSLFMLCIHILELNLFPWWEVTGKLMPPGMPEQIQLISIILGKFMMDILLTALCTKCQCVLDHIHLHK